MSYGGNPFGGGMYGGTIAEDATGTNQTPVLAVEVAFTTDALDPAPAWVDITPDVRVWDTSSGRNRELERFQPGRATVVLGNLDRQYDAQHAEGPWFGNLKPMRRIRIRETLDGVTYPRFDGFIDKWHLDYPLTGKDATATVVATDGFKVLTRTDLESVYVYEVREDEPVAWWRLGNPADVTTAYDVIGTRELAYTDNPRGGEAIVARDPNQSTFFDHPDDGSGNVCEGTVSTPIATYPFSLEFTFRSEKQSDTFARMVMQVGGNSAQRFVDVFIADSGSGGAGELTILLTDDQYATGAQYGTSGLRVDDKRIHHVVLSFLSSSVVEAWVDGDFTALGGAADTVSLPSGTVQVALGNIASNYPFAGEFGLDGELQDVVVYDYILSDARIAVHADAALQPWQGDLPGARADRILDRVGWPADLRSLDDGFPTLQSAEIAKQTALEHLQKIGETEYGLLFMDRAGNVRLIGQAALIARTAIADAVFGDESGEIGYRGITFDDGDQTIRNRATISRSNGAAKRSVSPDSVAEFGPFDYTLDGLLHQSDSWSLEYSGLVVEEHQLPRRRVTSLSLGPAAPGKAATLYPQMLGREIGDVITVRHRPPGGGEPFEQACVIEGLSHSGRPGGAGRTTRFILSPAHEDIDPIELALVLTEEGDVLLTEDGVELEVEG